MLISVYSFTAAAQRAEQMMPEGGSLLTLTYYGAEKVMPHYNVMGVAKAALEAERQVHGHGPRPARHPRQRPLRRPDQDAGRQRHRRLPLHHEVERAERPPPPQRHPGRRRQDGALPPLRPLLRRHRRDPPRRRRLPRGRHEGRGRARTSTSSPAASRGPRRDRPPAAREGLPRLLGPDPPRRPRARLAARQAGPGRGRRLAGGGGDHPRRHGAGDDRGARARHPHGRHDQRQVLRLAEAGRGGAAEGAGRRR